MKMRIVILCLSVVLISALLWSLRYRQSAAQGVPRLKTNTTAFSETIPPNTNPTAAGTNTGVLTPEEFAKIKPELERRRQALEKDALNEWRTPIELYGRVVDESNAAVPWAQVEFECNDLSSTGTSFYHTQSDVNGSFSIKDITGKLLVVHVSKKGYYTSKNDNDSFEYGDSHITSMGKEAPIVFHLRKKSQGVNLIQIDYPGFAHIAQLKHDGTPIEIDLFNGTQTAVGSGQLRLQFWRDLSGRNAKRFDWKLQISVPGGGVIETNEEFAFQAPESGYQSPVIIDESTNDPEWKGSLKDKYYLRLSDGKYGRIDFELLPYNGVFTIYSVINPSGSRNLEPAQ